MFSESDSSAVSFSISECKRWGRKTKIVSLIWPLQISVIVFLLIVLLPNEMMQYNKITKEIASVIVIPFPE